MNYLRLYRGLPQSILALNSSAVRGLKALTFTRETKGLGPVEKDCEPSDTSLCMKCHHRYQAEETFEKVATVIGIYKLAQYWVDAVNSDPYSTLHDRLEKQKNLADAEEMVEELVDGIENLSPASRQQLVVLFSEMKTLAVHRNLKGRRRTLSYHSPSCDEDGELISDPPSPEDTQHPLFWQIYMTLYLNHFHYRVPSLRRRSSIYTSVCHYSTLQTRTRSIQIVDSIVFHSFILYDTLDRFNCKMSLVRAVRSSKRWHGAHWAGEGDGQSRRQFRAEVDPINGGALLRHVPPLEVGPVAMISPPPHSHTPWLRPPWGLFTLPLWQEFPGLRYLPCYLEDDSEMLHFTKINRDLGRTRLERGYHGRFDLELLLFDHLSKSTCAYVHEQASPAPSAHSGVQEKGFGGFLSNFPPAPPSPHLEGSGRGVRLLESPSSPGPIPEEPSTVRVYTSMQIFVKLPPHLEASREGMQIFVKLPTHLEGSGEGVRQPRSRLYQLADFRQTSSHLEGSGEQARLLKSSGPIPEEPSTARVSTSMQFFAERPPQSEVLKEEQRHMKSSPSRSQTYFSPFPTGIPTCFE
ncbi:hypothetical protein FA13DRAFT_1704295 [Coprinellus micaceus]|uniref:Uncharacterized protein n=1 Tax=Coprinellus micaceus TaxID=71717 RepID=A0A4Y7U1Y2_COPMI|nr:hypothetical protein FA13DRAFT_1704295 [Coprinellus micaceus]